MLPRGYFAAADKAAKTFQVAQLKKDNVTETLARKIFGHLNK